MSQHADIADEVRSILVAGLGLQGIEINDTTELRELPGLDSMKMAKIVAQIEARFHIYIDLKEAIKVNTFLDLVRVVSEAPSNLKVE